jgi:hypothetical protein
MQPASAPPPPAPPRKGSRSSGKRVLLVLVLLVLAFAGGHVPQKLRADRLEETLRTTSLELELATAHRDLGIAALEAQRNNFANAAVAARRFFDACARLAPNPAFDKQPRTRIALGGYAAQRDEISVQLATGDPAVVHRLASLYLTMEGVLARRL